MGQMHLYGSQVQLEKLEKMGDPLIKIKQDHKLGDFQRTA